MLAGESDSEQDVTALLEQMAEQEETHYRTPDGNKNNNPLILSGWILSGWILSLLIYFEIHYVLERLGFYFLQIIIAVTTVV